ncbi:ABC transporter ATP-binding protein [Anaerospora sp.]|uniref:energy-coupling factor ABC transporter ATP-binding protein n=1 Tax=Anaerospora sp. TaxID=1960278 RepID=UPI00289E2179|nr:ABC transporter ATP-binding protein [Anaerospora sp.]
MLELQNITFGYNKNQPVLKDVSINIEAGEFIAIAGRNGSGKTTVTRLLTALKKPSSGNVLLNGQDAGANSPADMARHIGYVFQNPDRQIFRDSVAHEAAFGPEQLGFSPAEIKKAVDQALELTGLAELANAYPPTLSKGQKQRLTIASALAMQPKLLILDEPTSGQDSCERQKLLELLMQLNAQGVAIILVTHDMEIIARYPQRVIVMAEGEKVFDGTPRQLFNGKYPIAEWSLSYPAAVAIGQDVFPNEEAVMSIDELCQMLEAKLGGDR